MKTLVSRPVAFLSALWLALALACAPLSQQAIAKPAKPSAAAAASPDAAKASDDTPETEKPSYIVVDIETGKVLAQHNATERRYPASTTKLMTAYLALSAMRSEDMALDSPVVMTRRAAEEPPSKMGFQPGSVIRLDNALRMMLVKSANDMAYAIGQAVGHGSIEDFVAMMNATAARLGMNDTHYINPNGLPGEGQYSSAKDLAIIARTIRREFPAFADYFGTEAISNGSTILKNGNKLLGRFDGADGMKTGYICASGFNLVSSATRDGRTLIAVVMGANGTIPRERLSAKLLTEGFQTDPKSVDLTLDAMPPSTGAPLDISDYICSREGRTDRANERVEEKDREEPFGSPYMHEMGRSPIVVPVHLGGAAGSKIAPPGVSLIEAYGIPVPTPRPTPPEVASASDEAAAPSSASSEPQLDDTDNAKTTAVSTTAVEDAKAASGDPVAVTVAEPMAAPREPEGGDDGRTGRLGIYRDGKFDRTSGKNAPVPAAADRLAR